MSMFTNLVLCAAIVGYRVQATVNIANDGEIWYCNHHPLESQSIEPLRASDVAMISKLEQVQVMTRHGSRTHWYDLQRYFPDSTQYYHCNISTITTRMMSVSGNDAQPLFFAPLLQTYEDDNQFLPHSNCQHQQSMPALIQQHTENAHILMNAYMSASNATQLFDLSALRENQSAADFFKFYSSDFERCMLSTLTIASTLFNLSEISNRTAIQPLIHTITNDQEFNPYDPLSNVMCAENAQQQQWSSLVRTDYNAFIRAEHEILRYQRRDLIDAYTDEGGVFYSDEDDIFEHAGFQFALFYCNGFDIPLTKATFDAMIAAGREYVVVRPRKNSDDEWESELAYKHQCTDHFYSIPMYHRVKTEIMRLVNNSFDSTDDGGKTRFVLHSAHDGSIAMFLNGLGLYDGIFPFFAQFFTLEIYSSDASWRWAAERMEARFLFRFTHKGKFVPYEHCEAEYDTFDTQLCDLNILLHSGLHDADVSQREWAQKQCASVLDDCTCGYCSDYVPRTHPDIDFPYSTNVSDWYETPQDDDDDNGSSSSMGFEQQWKYAADNFMIGFFAGTACTLLSVCAIVYCWLHCDCCCPQGLYDRRHRTYDAPIMDDSDIEITEVEYRIEEERDEPASTTTRARKN